MPRPKYTVGGARPRAIRLFTDREDFIKTFGRAASDLPLEEHKVLVYYGVGALARRGCSKSWAGGWRSSNRR